jgi:hypothetical protein
MPAREEWAAQIVHYGGGIEYSPPGSREDALRVVRNMRDYVNGLSDELDRANSIEHVSLASRFVHLLDDNSEQPGSWCIEMNDPINDEGERP